MKLKNTLLVAVLLAGALTSCKKDDIPEPLKPSSNGTNTPAGNTTPTFSDADGVMWAINSTTVFGGASIQVGTGVAVFFNGSSSFVDVGNVALNDFDMTKQSNNTYVFTPSFSSPTGISFSSGVSWDVEGGSGHAFFSYDVPGNDFPAASAITSSSTVKKSDGYTITCASVTDADSTMFLIGNISKTVIGNATSCTFSASDLNGLPAGTTVVQIAPYKVVSETMNGKKYYFGKEAVRQLSVTVE